MRHSTEHRLENKLYAKSNNPIIELQDVQKHHHHIIHCIRHDISTAEVEPETRAAGSHGV